MRGRFQRAIEEGDLPANADVSARPFRRDDHARVSRPGASGTSRKELLRVKDMVLRMGGEDSGSTDLSLLDWDSMVRVCKDWIACRTQS